MNYEQEKPKLHLLGKDGNAFIILAEAQKVAKRNNMDWDKIQAEATSDDYNHLLRVIQHYFTVV